MTQRLIIINDGWVPSLVGHFSFVSINLKSEQVIPELWQLDSDLNLNLVQMQHKFFLKSQEIEYFIIIEPNLFFSMSKTILFSND